jgi:DNA ligase (NAD+)|tara:strand:- start:3110 stop:3886 length:777 start_codon:yes stop_codon:yes gene_type:complete
MSSTTILPPKNCPSCSSTLEWIGDQLFCMSKTCPAKSTKLVEHFSKTLKIKGLGPMTVKKLSLDSINKIYELDYDYVENCLGSSKLAKKLVDEIEKSKNADLQTLLPAFSIPLFGRSASEKLCGTVSDISEITADSCKRAGLGQKVTDNLIQWLKSFNQYQTLPFSWKTTPSKWVSKEKTKGIVCISGKLNSYKTKAIAKEILEANGYIVNSSLTKNVSILVNESGINSAKTKKAEQNNITIVNNINDLITGENHGCT